MASLAVRGGLPGIESPRLLGDEGLGGGVEGRGLLGPAGEIPLGGGVERQLVGQVDHGLMVGGTAFTLGDLGIEGFLALEPGFHDLLDGLGGLGLGCAAGHEGGGGSRDGEESEMALHIEY